MKCQGGSSVFVHLGVVMLTSFHHAPDLREEAAKAPNSRHNFQPQFLTTTWI